MKSIRLWGVRQNNLKDIQVEIPIGKTIVICGPSGSGKSSLAFQTLYAEGQRRFVESMSNYTKQFLAKAPKPDLEGVNFIPPAIALEQKNSVRSSRSTVGTTTEILDHLRVLFEKLAVVKCPDHQETVQRFDPQSAAKKALDVFEGKRGFVLVPVDEKNRLLMGKELLQWLLQSGIARIFVPTRPATKSKSRVKTKPAVQLKNSMLIGNEGEVIDIGPTTKEKDIPKHIFYLVVDRVVFNPGSESRLRDSLETAYQLFSQINSALDGSRAYVQTTDNEILKFSSRLECPVCDYHPPHMSVGLFSFNSPVGACPTCKGFGNILDIDLNKIIPNPLKSIQEGAILPIEMPSGRTDKRELFKYCRNKKISLTKSWSDLPEEHRRLLVDGDSDFYGIRGIFDYLETKKYKMHVRVFLSRFKSGVECPSCKGSRLRPEANSAHFLGKSIHDFTKMTIKELHQFLEEVRLSPSDALVADEPLRQLKSRLHFLVTVGVGYLRLNRETKTLSGGEYQRLSLANQIGVGLSQSLYVLDEPTVGLHPRDNFRLIEILKALKDLGNTVVIVEHDHDVIDQSDYVIEMGPESGLRGGQVIFNGPREDFYNFAESVTAPYLKSNRKWTPTVERRSKGSEDRLEILGCRGHNLKGIDLALPLQRLIGVTGVSGSGKSTLISKTLYPAMAQRLGISSDSPLEFDQIRGFEKIKNLCLIDQSSIGKTSRSNPVTYLKVYDHIRQLFSETQTAKALALTPGHFSLNVDGGRCPVCKGTGTIEIDMMFMDDVVMECEECHGKKFLPHILEVTYKGKSIFDVLNLTVSEAIDFFISEPQIRKNLMVLKEVGLDYIRLGQRANSLSGGESQRLKIAKELNQSQVKGTLYVLDEPTTGLHFREVHMLTQVLHQLVENGATVIVIEHNFDLISQCDHLIEIGPEAGEQGGELVFAGPPSEMIHNPKTITGNYLKDYLM